jgi:hypothetical protein
MSDRQLLEFAAKAAGVPLKPDFKERFDYYMADMLMWNPLTDDGDALRLAVKLRIDVDFYLADVQAKHDQTDPVFELFSEHTDPLAATRRAIVRAAAEIGRHTP